MLPTQNQTSLADSLIGTISRITVSLLPVFHLHKMLVEEVLEDAGGMETRLLEAVLQAPLRTST